MAETVQDLKQRVMERARECGIEQKIVDSFQNILDDPKIKAADWQKLVDWLQPVEKEAADALPDLSEVEDFSQYTEAELMRMQAQLEAFLNQEKGEAVDGEEKKPPSNKPPTSNKTSNKPPTIRASSLPVPSSGEGEIHLSLGSFLHG